jgi:hypothetical protein
MNKKNTVIYIYMNNQLLKGQTTMLRQVSDEVRRQVGGDCAAQAMSTAIRATIKWINDNCNITIPEIPHHELLPECTLAIYGRQSKQGKSVRKKRGEKTMNDIHNQNLPRTEKAKMIFRNVYDFFTEEFPNPKYFQNARIDSFLKKYGIDRIVTEDKDLVIEHLEAGRGANATISMLLTPKIANIFLRILHATTRRQRKSDTLEDLSSVDGYDNPHFIIEKKHLQSHGIMIGEMDHPIHGVYERLSTFANWWRHQMTIAGYNLDPAINQETQQKPPPYWIIKNSWGESFVDGGYFRVAMNAFEDCDYVTKGLEKRDLGQFAQEFLDPVGLCRITFDIIKPSDEICKNQEISITEPFSQTGEFEEEEELYSSFGWGGKRRKRRKTKRRKRRKTKRKKQRKKTRNRRRKRKY